MFVWTQKVSDSEGSGGRRTECVWVDVVRVYGRVRVATSTYTHSVLLPPLPSESLTLYLLGPHKWVSHSRTSFLLMHSVTSCSVLLHSLFPPTFFTHPPFFFASATFTTTLIDPKFHPLPTEEGYNFPSFPFCSHNFHLFLFPLFSLASSTSFYPHLSFLHPSHILNCLFPPAPFTLPSFLHLSLLPTSKHTFLFCLSFSAFPSSLPFPSHLESLFLTLTFPFPTPFSLPPSKLIHSFFLFS